MIFGAVALLLCYGYAKTQRGAYESAPYTVLAKDKQFEIRDYPEMNIVATQGFQTRDKQGNNAFRRLFKYITGQNEKKQKIAMTTPVYMQGEDEQRTMAFVMPSKMRDVPLPTNEDVKVTKIEAGRFATFRFNGSRTDALERQAVQKLKDWLSYRKDVSYDPEQTPVFGYFDPPFTPGYFRRNEVMLRLNQ